jgi:hypothetical protein
MPTNTELSKQLTEAHEVLEVARAALLDACYCEEGLDAATGTAIMDWITELLGDAAEYHPTIEGITDQTFELKQKAIKRHEGKQ